MVIGGLPSNESNSDFFTPENQCLQKETSFSGPAFSGGFGCLLQGGKKRLTKEYERMIQFRLVKNKR